MPTVIQNPITGSDATFVENGSKVALNITGVGSFATYLDKTAVHESGLVVMTHRHWRVGEGLSFIAGSYCQNIPANGSVISMVCIGSRCLHINWEAVTNGDAIAELFENVHVSNSGTQLPIFNRARKSIKTTNSTIWSQPIITSSGLIINSAFFMGGSGVGDKFVSPIISAAGKDDNWQLAIGSCYMLQVKNVCGRDMTLDYSYTMHEHNNV